MQRFLIALIFILCTFGLASPAHAQVASAWSIGLEEGGVVSYSYTVVDGDGNDVDLTTKSSVTYIVKANPSLTAETLATYDCDDAEMTCLDGSWTFTESVANLGCDAYCWHELQVQEVGEPSYRVWLKGPLQVRLFGISGGQTQTGTLTVTTGASTLSVTAVSQASSVAPSWILGLTESAPASGDRFPFLDDTDSTWVWLDFDDFPSGGGGGDNVSANGAALTNVNLTDSTEIGYAINRTASPDEVSPYLVTGSIANAKLANSSVSYGGVSVSLGASDATPAFDLVDATGYLVTSLSGTLADLNTALGSSIADGAHFTPSTIAADYSITPGNAAFEYNQADAEEGAPPAGDCNAAGEYGRFTVNTDEAGLYFCHPNGWTLINVSEIGTLDPAANYTLTGQWNFASATMRLPSVTSTLDGFIAFDSVTDRIEVGNGTSALQFYSGAHTVDTDDQTAAEVASSATGNIEATNVDAAIAELEAEKQPLDADLTDLADGSLTGTKVGFADTNSDFTATEVQSAIEELISTNGSGVNSATGKVHWTQLAGVPAGFADGSDDGAGGSAGTLNTIKEDDVAVGGSDIVTLDFGTGFDLAESPDTEIQVSIDALELESSFEAVLDLPDLQGNLTESRISDLAHTTDTRVNIKEANVEEQADATDLDFDGTDFDVSCTTGECDVTVNNGGITITESQVSDLSHTVDTDDQTAAEVTSTATGDIVATDVDAAIAELEAEKQPLDADLTDLADGSLTGSKVGTGISATNVTTGTLPDGVLPAEVPLTDEANTFSAIQTFSDSTVVEVGIRAAVTGSDPIISFSDGVTNISQGTLQVGGSAVFTAADGALNDDDVTAADVGLASPSLDDTDASVEWEDAADLDATGALSADVVAAAEMADADHGDVSWSAGVATVDNVAKANVAGAPTGDFVGTSDTQTLTGKTIDGDDNTLQDIPVSALASEVRSFIWPAGAMVADETNCAAPATNTIGTNGPAYTIICTDNDGSTIYGDLVMPDSWNGGTVTFELTVIQDAADTANLQGDISAQCRGDGETTGGFGTEVALDIDTLTGSDAIDQATSASVTPTGTCAAGDWLQWRWQMDATGTTTAVATLNIVGMKIEYVSTIGD